MHWLQPSSPNNEHAATIRIGGTFLQIWMSTASLCYFFFLKGILFIVFKNDLRYHLVREGNGLHLYPNLQVLILLRARHFSPQQYLSPCAFEWLQIRDSWVLLLYQECKKYILNHKITVDFQLISNDIPFIADALATNFDFSFTSCR